MFDSETIYDSDFPFFITINGKVFFRQRMLPAHDHVLYACRKTQQSVKVRYSKFYSQFEIEGSSRTGELNPYRVYVPDLKAKNIYMDERFIVQHFTRQQNEAIGKAVEAVLAEVWKR